LAIEKSAPSRDAWNWRRDQVAASIAEVKPTILAIQEIESRRVLWYLTRALDREQHIAYKELAQESADLFTEQDVGFLYRDPAQLLSSTIYAQTKAMRESERYFDVSKHIAAIFEVPVTDAVGKSAFEQVIVMNVHLRSTEEAEPIRIRQCRLLRHWLDESIRSGANIILLGDFNTELQTPVSEKLELRPLRDLELLCTGEANDPKMRLIDLHSMIPPDATQTHLLPGRMFDRILVSRPLIEDDSTRLDLVVRDVRVLKKLAIRGSVDTPETHWEHYWKIPESERDLSDHYPLLATFDVR
jgi:endonuclease/exonuclease/phosphatase family metal-dependent hydrolase